MKLVTLLTLTVIGTITYAQNQKPSNKSQNILACHADMTEEWGGYNIFVKKLSDNSYKAVMEQYNTFSKDDYSKPFVLTATVYSEDEIEFSSEKKGIHFNTYMNDYSGVLVADAYDDEYEGSVELLCERMTEEETLRDYADERFDDTDYSNLVKLIKGN